MQLLHLEKRMASVILSYLSQIIYLALATLRHSSVKVAFTFRLHWFQRFVVVGVSDWLVFPCRKINMENFQCRHRSYKAKLPQLPTITDQRKPEDRQNSTNNTQTIIAPRIRYVLNLCAVYVSLCWTGTWFVPKYRLPMASQLIRGHIADNRPSHHYFRLATSLASTADRNPTEKSE